MTDGNDNAFPLDGDEGRYTAHGLTKREHFAAMAMQGMFTNELLIGPEENVNIAKDAVEAADALIEALNAQEQTNVTA